MKEFRVDVGNVPQELLQSHPRPGDVYRKRGGPAGFMIVVSNNGSTFGLLNISVEGEITGVGTGTDYYLSRRDRVGYVEDFPELKIVWDC